MTFHILDCDEVPQDTATVTVNCGVTLTKPRRPTGNVMWEDPRVCEACLTAHRQPDHHKNRCPVFIED